MQYRLTNTRLIVPVRSRSKNAFFLHCGRRCCGFSIGIVFFLSKRTYHCCLFCFSLYESQKSIPIKFSIEYLSPWKITVYLPIIHHTWLTTLIYSLDTRFVEQVLAYHNIESFILRWVQNDSTRTQQYYRYKLGADPFKR